MQDTPEERVRQKVLKHMLVSLGFPKGLLLVERALEGFPKSACRRIDILSLMKDGDTLKPLLLVECKAGDIAPSAKMQLAGYNAHVKAPFFALANESCVHFGYWHCKDVRWLDFIPPYFQIEVEFKKIKA